MEDKILQPHQQRVVDERTELMDKITKLHEFYKNPIFNNLEEEDKNLLKEQDEYMMKYADTLKKRIDRF